ncbi:methyl-accepting chemotaxis protein [Hydrogenobaculum acidophilum]
MSIKAKLWSIIFFIFVGASVAQISLYFTGKHIENKIISLDKAYHQNENLHKLFEEILTLKNTYSTILIDPSNNFARNNMYFPALKYVKSHETIIKDQNLRNLLDKFIAHTLDAVNNINSQNQQQYMQDSIKYQTTVWQPFRKGFNKVLENSKLTFKQKESETINYINSVGIKLMISSLMALLVAIATFFVEKDIQSNINKLINVIQNITKSMRFDYLKTSKPELKGEFGDILDSLSRMLNEVDLSMNEIEKVIKNIAKGNFKERVNESELDGDLKNMARVINESLSKFDNVFHDINDTLSEVAKGNLSVRIDSTNLEGDLKDIVENMNKSLEKLNLIINDIKNTLESLAMGDMSVQIKEFAAGDIEKAQKLINDYIVLIRSSMQALRKVMETSLMSK